MNRDYKPLKMDTMEEQFFANVHRVNLRELNRIERERRLIKKVIKYFFLFLLSDVMAAIIFIIIRALLTRGA